MAGWSVRRWSRARVLVAGLVVSVLAVPLVPAPSAVAGPVGHVHLKPQVDQAVSAEPSPVRQAGPTAAQDGETGSALAAARRSGKRVEVSSQGSEWQRTFANPDGTFTVEQYTEAVRVRRADGSWTPVDTSLRLAGGQVRPAAVVGDVSFSAGGAGPLAVIGRDGKRLSLSLPWRLPVPVLRGPTATYRDVLPGVDLVLTAQPEGFSEVLVIRSRQAAANPALRRLRFAVETAGLSVRAAGGGFVAVDAAGEAVFSSPAPVMWDSAGGAARSFGSAVQGDRAVRMATTVDASTAGGAEVAVVPDRKMLMDPATVFPVYVDPSVTGSRNKWAMISSGFPTQEYYNFAGDEGVGLCDVQVEWTCNVDQVKRLIWEFGIPAQVHHSHVLSATFSAYETNAWDCTADEVQLWWVGMISPATNWSNHAGTWYRHEASANVARKTGCSLGPGSVEFNATRIAGDAAAGSWTTLTLGLRAGNEGSMPGGWKRFRNDATLSITYNSYPTIPSALAVENKSCGAFVPTATPTLRSHIYDPDGDTDLTVEYAWDRWNTTTGAWDRIGSLYQYNRASNTDPTLRLGVDPGTGSALEHGRRYRWTAMLLDPYPGGTDASGWAPWCEFEVDTQNPTLVPQVSSPVYLEYIPGVQEDYHGGVGQTEPFTFTANGVSDVAGFKWGWNDPPTTYVPADTVGGQATVNLTPPPPYPNFPEQAGTLTLYVRSVDRAGREGPVRVYPMRVGMAGGAVGAWDLAEPAGSTLRDISGNIRNATPSNVTLGSPGRLLSGPAQTAPTVGTFNGTNSYATTAGPVIDTSDSFSVAVWAKLTATGSWSRQIVSQDGNRVSGFGLWWTPNPDGFGRWQMVMAEADSDDAERPAVVSPQPVQLGVWTHLVGVYDRSSRQMTLYVNGEPQGTKTISAGFNATGSFVIGRGKWNGSPVDWWAGDIAEVRAWQRVLSPNEIAPMAATQVGAWSLDGHGGDDSDWGRQATPTDVTWVNDRYGSLSSAGRFNGSTSGMVTAGPAVRSDQSWTVMLWVRLTSKTTWADAIAQKGDRESALILQYDWPSNRWALAGHLKDEDDPVTVRALSLQASTVGAWTHLAGVYDASARQLKLYVNGILQQSVPYTATWNAAGPLLIGYDWHNGTVVSRWTGDIDDVRVFAGALPASEIQKFYQP